MANTFPIKAGHLFIGLAVIMGLGTLAIFTNLGKKPNKVAKVEKVQVETQQIVVPMSTIVQGTVIGSEDVKAVAWPKDFLPAGQTFMNTFEVVGRVAKHDLYPGEPIYIEKVSGPEGRAGMPAIIPPGLRAVTVAVSEVKAVAGFVKPGDRVDVLVTFSSDDGGSNNSTSRYTKTVLQNVLVLAAAQEMNQGTPQGIETPPGVVRGEATASMEEGAAEEEGDGKKKKTSKAEEKKNEAKQKAEDKKAAKEADKERARREKERKEQEKRARDISSVTLAVTPEQAQIITMAEEVGELRLVMRADADNTVVDVAPSATGDILSAGGRAPAPRALPEPEPSAIPDFSSMQSVEVIQGTTKSTVSF